MPRAIVGGSSLDHYGQSFTLPSTRTLPLCPAARDRVVVELRTGRIVPARCKSLRCAVCIVIEARRCAAAIALARPEHHIVLTRVGDDWPTIRRRMNRLREYLRRRGVAGEWAWHVEANPDGTGHHVHAWHWGSEIPRLVLRALAVRAGMGGQAKIEDVFTPTGAQGSELRGAGAMTYGMKTAIAVPADADAPRLTAQQEEYLRINGKRLCHASRSFWRDEHGRRIQGRKQAVRAARAVRDGKRGSSASSREKPGRPGARWTVMTRAGAERLLSLAPYSGLPPAPAAAAVASVPRPRA